MPATDRPPVVRVYDSVIPSGNAHKVHLVLSHLGAPAYETVDLDILADPPETRRPAFLAVNPNGRIPTVELADGQILTESGAIAFYLADGTPLLPDAPIDRARVLQWMFFEQYSHEPYVAVLKFWTYWGGLDNKSADELAVLRTRGQAAIDVMETHLRDRSFFVGERYSIADIALYAYTRSAEHIGFDVGPGVTGWLARVEAQPGYVPPKADPLGKAPR